MPKYKHYFVVDIILAAIFIFIAVRAVNGSLNEYAYYSTETEETETQTETRRRPAYDPTENTETETETAETEEEDEGDVYIVTINLNFRTEPNINSEVIEVLSTGTKVKVIDTTESEWWWKIEYDGRTGYVDKSYLTKP
ncbi:MAG: SH3 domain-containing protein [Lachnospiraceae bacterium]|nr:SH3 domain-containing protein [Lachnospiraceae bacterium]